MNLNYLKQQQDSIVDVDRVLKTYIQAPSGIYWGEELFDSYINQWQTSALAYKILKNYGGHEKLMEQMRDYFLQLNPAGRSTIERATLLELFLEDELLANKTVDAFKGEVWINEQKIDSFPYYKSFEANEAIQIKKTGTRVNVQINTITNTKNPHGNDSLLTLSSWFEQTGIIGDSLVAGKPLTYHVQVDVKADMKYVLLEIPIPSTCIYNTNIAHPNPNEVNRNNLRHITSISCATLPAGKHHFTINLIPRYEGLFQVLPVKVAEMYVPVNVNYTKSRRVVVKKK